MSTIKENPNSLAPKESSSPQAITLEKLAAAPFQHHSYKLAHPYSPTSAHPVRTEQQSTSYPTASGCINKTLPATPVLACNASAGIRPQQVATNLHHLKSDIIAAVAREHCRHWLIQIDSKLDAARATTATSMFCNGAARSSLWITRQQQTKEAPCRIVVTALPLGASRPAVNSNGFAYRIGEVSK